MDDDRAMPDRARIVAAAVLGLAGLAGLGASLFGGRQPIAPAVAVEASARSAVPQSTTSAAAHTTRIDINTAPQAELELLPGVGPVLAERIAADRAANGPFRSPDDLERVPGIGPRTAAKIAPLAAFSQTTPEPSADE